MTPKWQRARILPGRGGKFKLDGRLVWVEARPPEFVTGDCIDERGEGQISRQAFDTFWSNLISRDGTVTGIPAFAVELLPDFSDDVPLVLFTEFLAGKES
jgi:hypothetical protein